MSFDSGLTRPALIDPTTGRATYYDDQDAAMGAASEKLRAVSAQQEYAPLALPDADINASGIATTRPPLLPIVAPAPSFRQLLINPNAGGLTSPAYTTKGRLLAGLLRAGQGVADAVEGGAFDRTPWGGPSSFTRGFSAARQLPAYRARQNLALRHAGVENALDEARLQTLPLIYQGQRANLERTQAETDWYKARTNAKEGPQVHGDLRSGIWSVGDNGRINILQQPEDVWTARQEYADSHPERFKSDEERNHFINYGSAQKDALVTRWGSFLQQANGDPVLARKLEDQADIAKHNAMRRSESDSEGMTAGERRKLMSDPEYSADTRLMNGLIAERASQSIAGRNAFTDNLDGQIQDLQDRLNRRKDALLGGNKSNLPKGAKVRDYTDLGATPLWESH